MKYRPNKVMIRIANEISSNGQFMNCSKSAL